MRSRVGITYAASLLLFGAAALISCGRSNRSPAQTFTEVAPKTQVDPNKIPDGRTPDKVMSIDLVDTPPANAFGILAEVTGKTFRYCGTLEGKITYQRRDVAWQTILQELAKKYKWHVQLKGDTVSIC